MEDENGRESSCSSMDSFLFCDICDIQASSESQLRSHLLGQKHWFNVKQRDVAQRSVYVRGFPHGVGAKRLSDLFQKFGNIHKVVLDDQDKFAIIEFKSTDSALQTLRSPGKLSLDGSKLIVKPREFKVKKKRRNDSSMEVDKKEEDGQNVESGKSLYSLKLKSEEINAITSLQTLNEQLSLLASILQIPSSSLTHIHRFISYLQSILQRLFPSCRVVPFGSVVTGLATPTSDLDAVVITQWSSHDESHLGHTYYAPLHFTEGTHSIDDFSVDIPHIFPDFSFSLSPTATTTLITTPSNTPSHLTIAPNVTLAVSRSQRNQPFRQDCVAVVNELSKLKECGHIVFRGTARCPIIRFTHREFKVACDLSVNDRLGAYNTRLLQAYFNFDPRVVPLLHILKSWIRSKTIIGLSKVSLNNYAVSLMLIYALQKTTPPVLPCLQSPGVWPRNMEWYGKMGFSLVKQEDPLIIEGWNVGFTDPQSLLPSQNKASLGELLHHFFNFYSHIFPFSSHAITIHSNTPLSMKEATELACSKSPIIDPSTSMAQSSLLKISPLCVQDPFDLAHNVTKSFSHSSLHSLIQEMTQACGIINELMNSDRLHETGILSLFSTELSHLLSSPSTSIQQLKKSPRNGHILQFDFSNIQTLLYKIPSLSLLCSVLPLLDLKSTYVQRRLQAIVLRCLVILLEDELNFECVPLSSTYSSVLPKPEVIQLGGTTSASMTTNEDLKHVTMATGEFLEPVTVATNKLLEPIAMATSKILPESVTMATAESRLKRSQSEEEIEMDSKKIEMDSKKIKMEESSMLQEPINILEQYCYTSEGQLFPCVIKCTARSVTWRGMRQKRRHKMDVITNADSPCPLQFTMLIEPLTVTPSIMTTCFSDDSLVAVNISVSDESMFEELMHFYAYFRKITI